MLSHTIPLPLIYNVSPLSLFFLCVTHADKLPPAHKLLQLCPEMVNKLIYG